MGRARTRGGSRAKGGSVEIFSSAIVRRHHTKIPDALLIGKFGGSASRQTRGIRVRISLVYNTCFFDPFRGRIGFEVRSGCSLTRSRSRNGSQIQCCTGQKKGTCSDDMF